MVVPNGPRAARSASTWIHCESSVAICEALDPLLRDLEASPSDPSSSPSELRERTHVEEMVHSDRPAP